MPLNLNINPYFDDFDSTKNYHKILFVPGRALQARELTQIQSILQHQIKLNADYMFKNGAMIIPGNISYINNISYIKLGVSYAGVLTEDVIGLLLNKIIVGETTNVKASVIHIEPSTDADSASLYISYISGGYANATYYKEFAKNEVLYLEEDTAIKVQVLDSVSYTGKGSLAKIEEGVYYINGYFVQVTAQTLALDKFGSSPSCKIGLSFDETVISSFDDPSLKDPSLESSNYLMSGADRYKILLTLTKRELFESELNENTTNENFIDLMHIKNGQIQFKINKTELSEFEKTLARRTYDESGDYVVQPFKYEVHEYRNNNRGTWVTGKVYVQNDIVSYTISGKTQYFIALNSGSSGVTAPAVTAGEHNDGSVLWLATNTPKFNTGFYYSTIADDIDKQIQDSNLGLIKISEGKAYIKGFEIDVVGYRTATFNKARDFKYITGANIETSVGSYFVVDTLVGLPPITSLGSGNDDIMATVDLKDAGAAGGAVVGTCRVRNLEYHSGTIGTAACKYKAFVFDVKMNTGKLFARDVKKMITNSGSEFSASIVGTRSLLSGSVTVSGTTVTGFGTLFSLELATGDNIVINGTICKVDTITNAASLTIYGTGFTLTTKTEFYKEQTVTYGDSSLLKPLPNRFIRSLRDENDDLSNTIYRTRRIYSATTNGSGVFVLQLDSVGESFDTILSNGNYLISLATGNTPINTGIALTNGNTTLTASGLANTTAYRIITTIKKTVDSTREKQKIRKVKSITLDKVNSVDLPAISLTEADVINIVSITQSGGTSFNLANRTAVVTYSSTNEKDVSKYYKLDSGQTPTHYGISKIVPVNKFIPSAPIMITYEYYEHTSGDYFSVNSYDVPYDMLPSYNGISLGDYLDFRPRINDAGNNFDVSGGASVGEPLSIIYDFETDYSYYLPRRDILQLDSNGRFRIEEGTSSDTPIAPLPNDDNVILAYINLTPYTYTSNAANVNVAINPMRRYTMKDIGSIDNRLKNVEYYVSMTALEKSTSDMSVKDEFGLDRYKNGFIVDQFKDHGVGNISNPDYKCAIDAANKECRPTFYSDDIKLVEKVTQSRSVNHYKVTGDLVTLPYSHEVLIEQKVATGSEYVTPYTHIRSMFGDLKLYPASDTWVDTETIPDKHDVSEGNFKSVQSQAQSTGMLGTVWNSWQEQSRTTLSTSTSTATTSSSTTTAGSANPWSKFATTASTTTRTDTTSTTLAGTDLVTRSRSGSTTYVQEKFDEIGRVTNVVDTKWSPYMREKAVVVYAKRMLPIAKFDVYVDEKVLSAYLKPAATLRFTTKVGTFANYSESDIDQSNTTARQYGNNTYDLLEKGEVLLGKTSGATAIVMCEESQLNNGVTETVLKVINVIGTFAANEVILGQTSGATAKFLSVSTETAGTNLVTNSAGSFYGILMIPNNPEIKIPAGTITISLRDAVVEEDAKTKAAAEYDAQGITQIKQTTVMSVRNGVIAKRTDSQQTVATENWSRVTGSSSTSTTTINNCNCNCACACGDPLAQTFKHDDIGGVFVTKIDIYFHTVDQDPAMGIIFQIREVINGYPGPKVVPFSQVTKYPSELNSSKTSLTPTAFTFESPVYLEANKEYCFVVASENSNSKIWISKMGETDLAGNTVIKQPHMGTMFRSQNNTTWDADQWSDLCFTLYKAKFDISKFGHVSFKNSKLNLKTLETHPFKLNATSTTVRVAHKNHGLFNGDKVTFSGVPTVPSASSLNNTFVISNSELDSYTITIGSAATSSGWFGGSTVKATENKRIDTMFLRGNDFVLPNTHINYTFRTTTNDGTDVIKSTVDNPIQIKRNIFFDEPQVVLSTENSAYHLAGEESLLVDAFLYSNNENVSPIIDLPTYSVHSISNKINNPTTAINLEIDSNVLFDITSSLTGTVTFESDGYISIAGAGLIPNFTDELNAVKPGRIIKFSGTGVTNTGEILITNKSFDNTTYILYTSSILTDQVITNPSSLKLKQYENYIDIIVPETTSNLANYISKIVELENQSSGFKLMFDYNLPVGTIIEVYYKIGLKSNYDDLEKMLWTKITDLTFTNTSDLTSFIAKEIDMDPDSFDQITVKLAFKSDNTAKVPRIKNFRLLALA